MRRERGLTLVELLATLAIASLVLVGIGRALGGSLEAWALTEERHALTREARFALERMARSVSRTRRLLVPLAENPGTAWSESVRDVLAVTLDPTLDRDGDGWADANNDRDFQDLDGDGTRDAGEPERVDEDPRQDNTNDYAHGIVGIDDDGDGVVDEGSPDGSGHYKDNDEDGAETEDPLNGIDDDGDGALDEDQPSNSNLDGQPGIAGVDDDGDGSIDEGQPPDDDEDGLVDEDWLDVTAYRLSGQTLLERQPNPDPMDGRDFTERPIAEHVTQLRVEWIPAPRAVLVDLTLELTGASGEQVTLQTRVRVGEGL